MLTGEQSSLSWTGKLPENTNPVFQCITPVKPGQWFIINEWVFCENNTESGWKKRFQVAQNFANEGITGTACVAFK